MKIALLPTVVAIAWIGLMANVQAVAQYGPVAPASGPVAPPVAAPGTVPGAAPAATPTPTTNDPVLMDNGLWGGRVGRPLLRDLRRRQLLPTRLVHPARHPHHQPQQH